MKNKQQQNQPTATEVKDFVLEHFYQTTHVLFTRAYSESDVTEETKTVFEEGDFVMNTETGEYGFIEYVFTDEDQTATVYVTDDEGIFNGDYQEWKIEDLEHVGEEEKDRLPYSDLWFVATGLAHSFVEKHLYELSAMGLRIFLTPNADYFIGFDDMEDEDFVKYYAPRMLELYNKQAS